MLRAVSFENFVLFKEYQQLQFEEGPSFCVGPNGSGKSSLYELLRRCLSSEWNLTSSNIYDKSKTAFIICDYYFCDDLSKVFKEEIKLDFNPNALYACRLAIPTNDGKAENHFKIVCLHTRERKKCRVFLEMYTIYSDRDELNVVDKPSRVAFDSEVTQCLRSLIGKQTQDNVEKVVSLLRECTLSKAQRSLSECERCLRILTQSVALIFGKRSVDQTQLAGARKRDRGHVYDQILDRAQILDKLLDSDEVDEKKEKEYFNALTLPHKYEFKKEGNKINVTNLRTHCQTSLLKTSDGVVESKQLSLLFACRKFKTIILDDIERGMHPQMIRNLRELVLRRLKKKTVLLSTNSAELISQWTISKTFVFSYKMLSPSTCETKVRKIRTSILKSVSSEEMKKVLYCPYALFVEGPADKMVIYAVLHYVESLLANGEKRRIFSKILKETKCTSESFRTFLIGLYIVPQYGKTGHNNTIRFCEEIGVPCMHVYDEDAFMKKEGTTKMTRAKLNENYRVSIEEGEVNIQKINSVLEGEKLFMWNVGSLEQVVYGEAWTKPKKRDDRRQTRSSSASPPPAKKAKLGGDYKKLIDLSPDELDDNAKRLVDQVDEEVFRLLRFLCKMCVRLSGSD